MKNRETSDQITSEQFGELMGPISAAVQNISSTQAQYWVGKKGELARKVNELLVSAANGAKNILRVLANLSFKDHIVRGKYGWVNSDITEDHFPTSISADYDAEYKLFHFDRNISSDDAIREMEKEGFRPGVLAELLVLGETQPELQKQFPVVALGSIWQHSNGHRSVSILYQYAAKRKLDLSWFEFGWAGGCRFLAVRK